MGHVDDAARRDLKEGRRGELGCCLAQSLPCQELRSVRETVGNIVPSGLHEDEVPCLHGMEPLLSLDADGVLAPRFHCFHGAIHPERQGCIVHGLHDEIEGRHGIAFHRILCQIRHEDDRHIEAFCPECLGGIHATDLGKLDIEEDEVCRSCLLGNIESAFQPADPEWVLVLFPIAFEERFQACGSSAVIFYDEDAVHGCLLLQSQHARWLPIFPKERQVLPDWLVHSLSQISFSIAKLA
jgi:hypothetical protein